MPVLWMSILFRIILPRLRSPTDQPLFGVILYQKQNILI